MVKTKKGKGAVQKEPPSAFFARTRPKFFDWMPPTPDELLAAAQKRREERDAQLRKVTAIEKAKRDEKKPARKKSPVR
jgi:hypothetical protein